MPAIKQLLSDHEQSPKNLTSVCVAKGPGGFSSLRTGMSVAKGLAIAGDLNMVCVATLDLESYPYFNQGFPVCSMILSGKSDIASAMFSSDGERISDDNISSIEELAESIQTKTLFCGEGIMIHHDAIKQKLGELALITGSSPMNRLSSLVNLGGERISKKDFDDIHNVQPDYIKMPSIGGPKQRDTMRQKLT
jgi:tRNA threonylcarbamoyladenosine biosynthesis protein TsaB